MRDYTFERKKAATSTFSHPSLVSPHTPTLANPERGFGLPTNNIVQAQTAESANQQAAQSTDEQSLLSETIQQRSFGHDLSRISFRPQAKLTVGEPGDKYEQEADWMANQVMRMVVPDQLNAQSQEPVEDSLQRKCAACEQEEDKVQTKPSIQTATDGGLQAGNNNIESRLNSSKGGGSALPDEVRSFMEPRFGTDFSQVRVHTGSESVQMNRDLNAQAFTHKQDVYFGAGKAPAKDALTAHELTHVVQQTGAVQTKEAPNEPDVQLKCSACDEEAEVQRSVEISPVSEMGVQRSWFGDDDDEKKEPENSSGGGVLDWAKEKASSAVDTVTQAGGDAYDWAKQQGGAAVDTVTQAGGDAYDWAKQQGGAAVDTVTQAGSDAYDWAKETGQEYSNALLEKKKAGLLAQISGAIQKIAGQEFVYLTDSQIGTLNSHAAEVREKSQGLINLPEISAQTDSALSVDASGAQPVATSTIESILLNLQSSISAPFMSPSSDSDVSNLDSDPSISDSGAIQGHIQRFAPAIAAAAGLSLIELLALLALFAIIVGIILYAIFQLLKGKIKTPEIDWGTDDKPKEKVKEKVPKTGPSPLPNPNPDEDKEKRGGMRSQIQRVNDHLGSADVVASNSKKGVTAREFEQIAMIGALNDYRDRRNKRIRPFGTERNEKNITFAFAEQSKIIRGSIVPGGGLTQGGDINALRQTFKDAETGGEIRVDVENTFGHNLRFEE